jgi:hypothetical protein
MGGILMAVLKHLTLCCDHPLGIKGVHSYPLPPNELTNLLKGDKLPA